MEYVSAGPLGPLAATVWLAAIVLILASFGSIVLSAVGIARTGLTRGEGALFSFGAGFVIFGLALFALGLNGLFDRTCFLVALGAAGLACFFKLKSFRPALPRSSLLLGLIAVVLILSWVQAVAPPIGNDDLTYHLAYPKIFLHIGRVSYLPHALFGSLWPAQSGMFYSLGLSLQGAALAKLFHWIFYPLTAYATFLVTRRFWGERAGRLAGLLFLFIPAAYAQSGHAYVDLAYAFFVTTAFYAFLLRRVLPEGRAARLSGLLIGGALATKHLALGPAAILSVFWLTCSEKKLRSTISFCLVAFGIGCVWYLRSWYVSGNPVYPFFPQFFGGNGISMALRDVTGMGKGPVEFLLFLWNITLHPTPFGGEMIGPFFLMFLPFLLTMFRGARRVSVETALFAALYTAFLFSQDQRTRFVLSVAPLFCIGSAVALDRLLSAGRLLRFTALSALCIILAAHAGIFVYRIRDALPFAAGRGTVEDYLSAHERSYKGYVWLRDHSLPEDRIFNAAEWRMFYCPFAILNRTKLNEDSLWKALGIHDYPEGADALRIFLEKEKFDLICVNDEPVPVIAKYLSDARYEEVYAYAFAEGGFTFHYKFYRKQA